jgi:hypothetical protein
LFLKPLIVRPYKKVHFSSTDVYIVQSVHW